MINSGSVQKVWWLGKCGHEWQATVNNRSNGHGCPICFRRNQSSFPEQAIFYYIGKCYPDAVNRYRDNLPNKMEIDIFIPSLSIGIEYDGIAWHTSNEATQRELKKYIYCKEHQIKLVRVREFTPLFMQEDCDFCFQLSPNPSFDDLNVVISKLLALLTSDHILINIDVALESTQIKENYLTVLSKCSLFSENPSLAEEWHPVKNATLLPSMFMPNAHDKVWWLGKCGHEWSAVISS